MKGRLSSERSRPKTIEILDTTLRERAFGVQFAVGEKLSVASLLDLLGVSYLESNAPTLDDLSEIQYSKQVTTILRRGTKPVLFFSSGLQSGDKNGGAKSSYSEIEESIPESIKHVSFNANCWQSHLTEDFSYRKVEPEANLNWIKDRVTKFKKSGKEVFVNAEHFFDGFFEDTTYALTVLETAVSAGASRTVLCDSRGATLPDQISKAVKLVLNHLSSRDDVLVGINCHNDCGLAVANTISAVQAGVFHVQGTVNGLGERSGNADLCQFLPILVLKMGYSALNSPLPREQQLLTLKTISKKVADISGVSNPQQPFVSDRAFAHVDPIHVSRVTNNPENFEMINPAQVGNTRRLGVDDASLILSEMWELGLYTKEREEVARRVIKHMRELEAFGYKFDDAKASVHLLILETLGFAIWPFQVTRWETSTVRALNNSPEVSGTIEVMVGNEGEEENKKKKISASAKGVGPIHAIDLALRKALENEFPELKGLKLVSYSLNIVDSLNGTAAAARARTEFADQEIVRATDSPAATWATTAVSDDVLDASIKALIDGYRYKLIFRSKTERFQLPDWKVALSWRYSERC